MNQQLAFYRLFQSSSITGKASGFVSNFQGTGKPALIMHAVHYTSGAIYFRYTTKRVHNRTGQTIIKNWDGLTPEELLTFLWREHSLDLTVHGNTGVGAMYLICCMGLLNSEYKGPDNIKISLVQEFANRTGRTIIAYGSGDVEVMKLSVDSPNALHAAAYGEINIFNNGKKAYPVTVRPQHRSQPLQIRRNYPEEPHPSFRSFV